VNRLQVRNQRAIRRSLEESKLIGSVTVDAEHSIGIERLDWDDYWNDCQPLAEQLVLLNAAWIDLIGSGHAPTSYGKYVSAYFALLKSCLSRVLRGEVGLRVLQKIIGFETFHIVDQEGYSVAGTINARNPVYLLSKLAQPKAFDDPKFLPLICPFRNASPPGRLYCHYRRIPVGDAANIQLFIYPPVGPLRKSGSHALIGRLFKSLTSRNDPWVKERSETLFDSVFDKLFKGCDYSELRMLDLACGSARVTVDLCKKGYAQHQKAFHLTLIDVVRSNKSLADVFYRNPSMFRRLVFQQGSLFDWVENHADDATSRFDFVLMLRVLDVFSRFHIEELSRLEATMLLHRDRQKIVLDDNVLDPTKLIDSGMQHRIQHSIKRTRLRRGSVFYQFSLSDYFKAIRLMTGGKVDERDDTIYVPVRRFDDSAFMLPSGRSLIGQLMGIADRVIIEDVDLTARHLREHLEQFDLDGLRATDVTDRQRMRGASVILVEKIG